MNIGKYSAAQILQASVLDTRKVRFGFFGGLAALICLYASKGLVLGLCLTGITASIVDLLGVIAFGTIVSVTLLGITAAVHAGFSAKKSKASLFAMGMEKLPLFIGTVLLFTLAAAIIAVVEYGLYLVGANLFFGPILLGIATPFLLVFNMLAIFILAFGMKYLPAYLITEKGDCVTAVRTLALRAYRNMPAIILNTGLLVLSVIPAAAFVSALLWGAFMSVIMVDRLVLQQAFFSGGFVEFPLFVFAVIAGLGLAALVLWAAVSVSVYVTAGLYSIYCSLSKK